MNISFQKQDGDSSLGIEFFWELSVHSKTPIKLIDRFIPELRFDYFFTKSGILRYCGFAASTSVRVPQQSLKTLHTHPFTFKFFTPITLYGARLSLNFAETFRDSFPANSLVAQNWVPETVDTLEDFSVNLKHYLRDHQSKTYPPIFSNELRESNWLSHYSDRQKRRIYKSVFGLSKKELQNIQNLHIFLEQTCDFGSNNPRIIQHVTPDVFYDQPHLNHAFKKMTGLSPVEYFELNSILQDNLMSASYNEKPNG